MSERPHNDSPVPSENGDWEVVDRCLDPVDAQLRRALLEGSGIPALAADFNTLIVQPLWTPAMGGVRVMVRAEDAAAARELLAAFARGELAMPADDAPPDPSGEDS